jgi:release factor glutamine methyltransferase
MISTRDDPPVTSWPVPDHLMIVARLRAAGCVFAEDEAALLADAATSADDLERRVTLRESGLPLEQVVGWAMFCGLRIAVDPGVFVPRWRTQFLVSCAVRLTAPASLVVDLCCGTGALGVALAMSLGRALGGVELYAADVDPAAVRCARRNVATVGGQVLEGDLFAALPAPLRGRVDLLLANVPYVPTTDLALLPPEARDHEPRIALDGGRDGLDVLRRVAAEAPAWLAPGGCLLTEVSERQAAAAKRIVGAAGLRPEVVTSDDDGATVVVGTGCAGAALPDWPDRRKV